MDTLKKLKMIFKNFFEDPLLENLFLMAIAASFLLFLVMSKKRIKNPKIKTLNNLFIVLTIAVILYTFVQNLRLS